MNAYIQEVLDGLKARAPWEAEFLQAAEEVLESIAPLIEKDPKYKAQRILERIVEPERTVIFRVPWINDKGEFIVNRGYRVQFNSAIGPYKGGLRFHPKVTLSTLKFLGFEQMFKNSLTSLPMGGGKGGSDFDPNGKSDNEIMRFCQSFMSELFRFIGPDTDVPAGDIGVGGREVGFLFGQYKKLTNEFTGVLTGKGRSFGGSLIRPEATGFGAIYFAEEMFKLKGQTLKGKTISVSGFGNVAWGACIKAADLGAKVVTISGPDGYVFDPDGINTKEKFAYLEEMLVIDRNKVETYVRKFPNAKFFAGKRPWEQKVDIAMPCAIQNELSGEDAQNLLRNGVQAVVETSNMGCTPEAWKLFIEKKIPFAPGKAANAGGVATSGLEMSQNSARLSWTAEEVDARLHQIMVNIHSTCVETAKEFGFDGNYVIGANIAGFKKVADAMIAQGLV
ncbi:MAG: glutamate dehydrogenase [Spirochaetes bacterium GWD1_61_31]|nr:MAG: glutamate dehydrogenase [Spirochaetes bacterium GWB1_60_80]OHD28928.1 MAG: glutamate dehydrogenase [Spirochaetes bacterium GWC1_61_12]OHD39116.1 MAG: glutamate dehydrogenase [Spirochaetes bacterium GWD1_61_31]OHD43537.1 MAG: glutamate dehydrogenase [Spirochaetes bacterium GWE1_60_18]OHD59004.1 MAG: glutamate dehydrogenase [Spirochaetes bacterium GWF1_60_12]HAP44501.1 NADP-specific glutamate dehydrogenase [Spirochaetaceae bacterium]